MPPIAPDIPETPRRASYKDVLDAPPHKIAQIVDGTLHLLPRPAFWHTRASSRIGRRIGAPYEDGIGGPGGWVILDEPELHLGMRGEDILVPDLAGWRIEKFSEGEDVAYSGTRDVAYHSTAPDWICEVLSPSTRDLDRGKKRDIYAREGVSWLWLIDPGTPALEAFVLQVGEWKPTATLIGDAKVSVPPFDEISFPLSDLCSRRPDRKS